MGKITEKIKELFGYFKGGADRFRVTVVVYVNGFWISCFDYRT